MNRGNFVIANQQVKVNLIFNTGLKINCYTSNIVSLPEKRLRDLLKQQICVA